MPSEQEEVATAKTTTVGLKEPVKSRLDGITGAYYPEIDGSAMRTVRGEQSHNGANHNPASAFAALLFGDPAPSSLIMPPETGFESLLTSSTARSMPRLMDIQPLHLHLGLVTK
jgi:hypothetical protein